MIFLLIAGFALLVQGLSLMAIWLTLALTVPGPKEVISKLMLMGKIITSIGFVIIIIGVLRSFLSQDPQETAITLSTGSNVTALGIASIIRASGHANERKVWTGALVVTGIGIGLILAYLVTVYLLKCIC